MWPMSIAETPIAAIRAHHTATGDGVHLVARHYRKGVRLDTHMHREAQLVYAAKGTMQVTTPKGRWLGPPGPAGWRISKCAPCISTWRGLSERNAARASVPNSSSESRGCCTKQSSRCSMAAI